MKRSHDRAKFSGKHCMRRILRWGFGIALFALLYRAGGFGVPPQFHPWTTLTGCLLVYAWRANRPDTFALIFVAYSMFLSLGSGFLSSESGATHFRWLAMWEYLRPRVGWLLLGGTGASLVLDLIGFPRRFYPGHPQPPLQGRHSVPSPDFCGRSGTMAWTSPGGSKEIQTVVDIRHLALSFVVTQEPIEVFAPAELKHELAKWKGRTIFIDYQSDIDGPQTAARLINEVFQAAGIIVRGSDDDAEAHVWIQAADVPGRFAFAVVSPLSPKNRIANMCGPRELTAVVMRAVSLFFSRFCSGKQTGTPQLIGAAGGQPPDEGLAGRVDSLLAQIDFSQGESAEATLLSMGEAAVDNLVASTVHVNRRICAALLSGDADHLQELFGQFATRLRILGAIRSPRAVKTLLDALADSTQTATSGLSGAELVRDTAVNALVYIGEMQCQYCAST